MTDPAPPTLRILPTLNLLPHGRLGPPDRPLTREEHIARYERRGLAACLAIGADPCALRIGEHGSLIGGPDKPLSASNLDCPPEYRPPWNPLPLSWFTHRRARSPLPGGPPDDQPVLAALIGDHLAGYPNPPSTAELARAIHFSGIRRPAVIDWLHMFAVRPESQP